MRDKRKRKRRKRGLFTLSMGKKKEKSNDINNWSAKGKHHWARGKETLRLLSNAGELGGVKKKTCQKLNISNVKRCKTATLRGGQIGL